MGASLSVTSRVVVKVPTDGTSTDEALACDGGGTAVDVRVEDARGCRARIRDGLANTPRLGAQVKYRRPDTVPSFFPTE